MSFLIIRVDLEDLSQRNCSSVILASARGLGSFMGVRFMRVVGGDSEGHQMKESFDSLSVG